MDSNKTGFFRELINRFIQPWTTAFTGFFIFFVIIMGGAGIIASLIEYLTSDNISCIEIAKSMATYFIAILATSFIEANLAVRIKNRVSNLIYLFFIFIVGCFLLALTFYCNTAYAFIPASIGFIFALFIWVIAKSENDYLSDENFNKLIRTEVNKKHGKSW